MNLEINLLTFLVGNRVRVPAALKAQVQVQVKVHYLLER
jgi:hypothetical protein